MFLSVGQGTKTVYRQVVGHFLSSPPSLVTAPGLRVQPRPSTGDRLSGAREGLSLPWTEEPVLPAVGMLTEEPAWALASGCHSVQGSMWPEHHRICRELFRIAGTGQGRAQRAGPGEKGSGGRNAGRTVSAVPRKHPSQVHAPSRQHHPHCGPTFSLLQDGQSPSATSLLGLKDPAPLSLPRLRPARLRPLQRARLSAVAGFCVVGGSDLWGGGIVWEKRLLNLGSMAHEPRLCTRTDSAMATSEARYTQPHTGGARPTQCLINIPLFLAHLLLGPGV